MTEDRDFKRVVRRRAQQTGENYTQAQAHLRATVAAEPGWLVVFTIGGAEERVRRWLLLQYPAGIAEALFPRREGHALAPGLVLVRPTAELDLITFGEDPWIRDYLGAPDQPKLLSWDEVKVVLKEKADRQLRKEHRSGPRWANSRDWLGRIPVPLERDREVALFEAVAATKRSDSPTSAQRNPTPAEIAPEAARATLLHAHRWLVDDIVGDFVGATDLSLVEMAEAGMAGLRHAIERYAPSAATLGPRFSFYATWWVRLSIVRGLKDDDRHPVDERRPLRDSPN